MKGGKPADQLKQPPQDPRRYSPNHVRAIVIKIDLALTFHHPPPLDPMNGGVEQMNQWHFNHFLNFIRTGQIRKISWNRTDEGGDSVIGDGGHYVEHPHRFDLLRRNSELSASLS